MRFNLKETAAGFFFIAVGSLYMYLAAKTLPIGRAIDMGPGYFPILLSGALILIGIAIVVKGAEAPITRFGVVPWRAVITLSLSTIVFATFLNQLGLLLTTFVTSVIACCSSRDIRWKEALLTSICIAIFCSLIFGYGIKLPVPMIGSWFRG